MDLHPTVINGRKKVTYRCGRYCTFQINNILTKFFTAKHRNIWMEEGVFHKHNYLQSLTSYMQAKTKGSGRETKNYRSANKKCKDLGNNCFNFSGRLLHQDSSISLINIKSMIKIFNHGWDVVLIKFLFIILENV